MMATTVRVQDEDKAILDELQARHLLATGERISLDELVHKIVELAQTHEDEIILEDAPARLAPGELKAFLGGVHDSSLATSEEDIDQILYGGEDAA